MAGLSALQSKIGKLSKASMERKRGKQVSVVTMNRDGTVDWPENCNNLGVLLVPAKLSDVEWEAMAVAAVSK